MFIKKILSAFTVLLLLSGMLGACANKQQSEVSIPSPAGTSSEDTSVKTSVVNNESVIQEDAVKFSPFGKYDPPIQLTTVRYAVEIDNAGQNEADNNWYTEIEKTLGIKIINLWVTDSQQMETKTNLMIASGDMPDFVRVTKPQFLETLRADLPADITDVFNSTASDDVKTQFLTIPAIMDMVTRDEKILAVPETNLYVLPMMWIRHDWMEKLNLPEPKNFADVINIARIFKDRDPGDAGGNIGFAGDDSLFSYQSFYMMFAANHAYPQIFIKKDEKVTYGSIQPEVKTALQMLVDLYSEGLIDPEWNIKDGNARDQLVRNGKAGIFGQVHWGPADYAGAEQTTPGIRFQCYPLMSNDGQPVKSSGSTPVNGMYIVSKDCKTPEAVIKLFNLLFQKQYQAESVEEWAYFNSDQSSGDYIYNLNGSPIRANDPLDHYNSAVKLGKYFEGTWQPTEVDTFENLVIGLLDEFNGGDESMWFYEDCWGPNSGVFNSVYLIDNGLYFDDEYMGVPTATMVDKLSILNDRELVLFTEIIIGQKSIDEFDNFVTEWLRDGGQQIIDELNEQLGY